MLDDDFFRDRVNVHLEYARTRPGPEALRILELRLGDGSFEKHPVQWLTALSSVADVESSSDVERLRSGAVRRLCAGGVGPAAHATMKTLIAWDGADPEDVRLLVAWFTEKAGPGDAAPGADVLQHAILRSSQNDDLRVLTRPLAGWLLDNGAAELRARRRGPLLVGMSLDLFALGDRPATERVLRFLVAGEAPIGMPAIAIAGNDHAPLLDLLNDLVTTDSSLVLRFVDRLETGLDEHIVRRGLLERLQFREAIVRGLFSGQLRGAFAAACWGDVFRCADPPSDATFVNRRDCLLAAQAFAGAALLPRDPHGALRNQEGPRPFGWAKLLTGEILRVTDLLSDGHADQEAAGVLAQLLVESSSPIMDGAHRAMLTAARSASGRLGADIARLLDDGGPWACRAALELIRAASVPRSQISTVTAPLDVLTRFVEFPWLEPVGGLDVARVLAGVRGVRPARLVDEDKLRIDGEELLIDEPELTNALSSASSDDERRALAAIYFAHELVHLEQAIGDKSRVVALRARGMETTVMHLDLAADHLAALLVERVFPRWPLIYLKDLQGRGLAAFPANPTNTTAARARKAVRLVSLRVDWLLRSRSAETELGDGYVFADYGPAEGMIFALASGPPLKVLTSGQMSARQAAVLDSAADAGSSCAAIDGVLLDAFGLKK